MPIAHSVDLSDRAIAITGASSLMRAQGGGHIVNVSSVAGRVANAGSGVYNLTKWGVNAFSEALRQETVDSHVRVTGAA
jgi:NADP-dependent 3-hydroxy acid dehydrogenase YdfG